MSLFDIYKAKKLGISIDTLFGTVLGKSMAYKTITEKTPYVKRTVANGAAVWPKCRDTIVGGTISWNQLVPNNKKSFSNTTVDSRAFTLLLRLKASPYTTMISTSIGVETGKFTRLFSAGATGGLSLRHNGANANITIWETDNTLLITGHKYFFSVDVINNDTSVAGGLVLDNLMMIDITKAFGSSIADYIFSLEQTNSGKGIEYFQNLFPKSYYSNASLLESVNTSAHIIKDASDNIVGNYALDQSLTLRGIPKLDASYRLYYDGDIYESDGKVTRNCGVRAYQEGDMTDGLTMVTDGVNTVYKLESSIVETAEGFTNPQSVITGGTEEYTDYGVTSGTRDVAVPVGHNTQYKVLEE